MLFNSLEYFIFLPIVFLLYWFVFNRNIKIQNLFVVIVSFIFYGWWNWNFLLLLAFTTLSSYVSAIMIVRSKQVCVKKIWCFVNVILNLYILGVYKYYDFFIESFIDAFATLGVILHAKTLGLILPIGISFYTFQALSYTIDVYRGKLNATKDIIAFFAFMSFFPGLVAGPIERATNLLPQFQQVRYFNYEKAVDGTRQILFGLFKKMLIADNCADVVDKIWLDYSSHSTLMLVIAAILFAFQIYGDFSGYSDIAIGTAKLFGIQLTRNFNLPYFSRNVAEFWKRWHISLNTWFVDYVYIPLGGSKKGKWKSFRNTFIIFLLSGLWHGANWTYVCWGIYHAFLFLPLLLLGKNRKYKDVIAQGKLLPSITDFFHVFTTFSLVVFGWIIFRANNITEFFNYIRYMISNYNIQETILGKKVLILICLLLAIEWINRTKEHAFAISIKTPILRWGLYFAIAFMCLTMAGKQVQFIYFQF